MTRIAIIGCGRQGAKHISGYRALAGVEIVLADRSPARARARRPPQPLSNAG